MSLRYDFDVHVVVDEEHLGPDAQTQEPPDFGVRFRASGAKTALFRDPETAAALSEAPASVRTVFLDAGFGLNSHCCGVPDGFYHEMDTNARAHFLTRLKTLLETRVPKGHARGAFDILAFLEDTAAAKPVSDAALTSYHRSLKKKAQPVLDFDRTMFMTKVMGVVILAFITSRFTLGF